MKSLDQVILDDFNPFDPVSFKTGNFWIKGPDSQVTTVESIHAEAFDRISSILNQVAKDNYTRTILLTGDSGCGKSFLLNRVKTKLNSKAFFAYIGPTVGSTYVWQHTLRNTFDSLMHTPTGEKESQLILWLKSLPVFQNSGLMNKFLGEKRLFVNQLKKNYPSGIYQAKEFFGVLYELTQPAKYELACDWLRGENLDEEDLKALGVNFCLDNEEAAKGILANFGRIADATKPIVLCFDQVETWLKLPNGTINLSPVFDINTSFHNSYLKNFLVIITLVKNSWTINKKNIPKSDLARVEAEINLNAINLAQIQALWSNRLALIHAQANPKPSSNIAPLEYEQLEKQFPGGKVNLRESLNFGGELYQQYKLNIIPIPRKEEVSLPPETDLLGRFKLLWQEELKKTEESVTRLRDFSSEELTKMLLETLKVCGVSNIKPRLLESEKFADFSFSYIIPRDLPSGALRERHTYGIVWNENPNLTSFTYCLKAAQNILKYKKCDVIILLREEKCGKPETIGGKLYLQICAKSHFKVSLESLHYLRTYYRLATEAIAGDLYLAFKPVTLEELQQLIGESKVLENCQLLQDLKIFQKSTVPPDPKPDKSPLKEFIFNLVQTNHMLARKTITTKIQEHFSNITVAEIDKAIQQLCQESLIFIVNPQDLPEIQSICLASKNA